MVRLSRNYADTRRGGAERRGPEALPRIDFPIPDTVRGVDSHVNAAPAGRLASGASAWKPRSWPLTRVYYCTSIVIQ